MAIETTIYFGNTKINKAYLGSQELDKVYLGMSVLYQTLTEYTLTENLGNVLTVGTHPVKILQGQSLTLKYQAEENYQLPDNVTITGATSNWTKSTGTLVISNPTGNVTITIAAIRITYTITENLSNVTKSGTHPTFIAAGQTLVLTYTADTGYSLPESITVTGATSDWKPATGTLTLTNATAAVTITIAGVSAAPKLTTPTNLSVKGTELSFAPVENAQTYAVVIDGDVAASKFNLIAAHPSAYYALNEKLNFTLIESLPGKELEVNIKFISRGFLCNSITIVASTMQVKYSGMDVYITTSGTDEGCFDNQEWRYLSFLEAPSGDLLTWLQANSDEIDISSNTISTYLDSFLTWEDLSAGEHSVAVIANADGYQSSDLSSSVSITKS
uniref:Uncharacterized protein n=1 Tax=Myoviridae sp. ctj3P51 TaxID=2826687 RepID=A0A8S5NR06_9CAUD|nr:MAG TPA: hypothetical protein [Myoviridae sp. ctj3P51]